MGIKGKLRKVMMQGLWRTPGHSANEVIGQVRRTQVRDGASRCPGDP